MFGTIAVNSVIHVKVDFFVFLFSNTESDKLPCPFRQERSCKCNSKGPDFALSIWSLCGWSRRPVHAHTFGLFASIYCRLYLPCAVQTTTSTCWLESKCHYVSEQLAVSFQKETFFCFHVFHNNVVFISLNVEAFTKEKVE